MLTLRRSALSGGTVQHDAIEVFKPDRSPQRAAPRLLRAESPAEGTCLKTSVISDLHHT